jgi:hypothetical protein
MGGSAVDFLLICPSIHHMIMPNQFGAHVVTRFSLVLPVEGIPPLSEVPHTRELGFTLLSTLSFNVLAPHLEVVLV